MVNASSALPVPLHTDALLVDESSGAMVQHPPTQAVSSGRLCLERGYAGQDHAVHRRVESACPSVQLVHQIGSKSHGARAYDEGSLILCPILRGAVLSDSLHQ